jgi:hypothetical protein
MVALLASAAIAAPAFAVTGDVSGFLHVRGVAADNMDGQDKDGKYDSDGDGTLDADYDDNTRAVDSRLRLFTTAALNENVKAVFAVEVDYVWGDDKVGKVGADQKGEIEIANLYLDFNIPEANTNVKAGTHYYKLGGGLILGEHASGVSIRKAFSDEMNLGLYWVKMVEGLDEDDDQDVDYYQAQLDMKLGGVTVSPFIGYMDSDDNYDVPGVKGTNPPWIVDGGEQFYYGMEITGKAEALNYGMTAFYNDGNYTDFANKKRQNNSAYAILADADYTVGDTKLVFSAGRYGDSDRPDGKMASVRGYNNFAEVVTGGYFDERSNGVGAGYSQTASGSVNAAYDMNFLYGKLGVEQTVSDKSKLRAYYIYAEEAADNQTRFLSNGKSMKRMTFGHELDLYYDYTVVPGLVATLGGGYLLADDDFGLDIDPVTGKEIGGDDAWKAGLGLAYKF